MTHSEMNELYELYALGVLEAEEAAEINGHIADGCEYCSARLQDAVKATAMLSGLESPVEPSAAVRQRLMASLPHAKRRHVWNLWVPALATACAALLVFGVWISIQLAETRDSLQRVSGERAQLREALQVLSSSQPTLVRFGQPGRAAQGTVFFNRNGGFVMTGSRLPEIARDKTFELWMIPKSGAPVPAGLFHAAETGGRFVHVYQEPLDISRIAAVAVTVEPQQGSLAPTTKPFLVVPIG